MAKKITDLDAGSTPQSTDLLETSQSVSTVPVSRKISFSQIQSWIEGVTFTSLTATTLNASTVITNTFDTILPNATFSFSDRDLSDIDVLTAFQLVATSSVLASNVIASSSLEAPTITSQNADINFSDKDFANVGNIYVNTGKELRVNTITNSTADDFVDFPNGVRAIGSTVQADTGNFDGVNTDGIGALSGGNLVISPGSGQTVSIGASGKLSLSNTLTVSGAGYYCQQVVAAGDSFFEGRAVTDTNARLRLFSQGANAAGIFLGAGNSTTGAYIVYDGSTGAFSFSRNQNKTGAASINTQGGTIFVTNLTNSSSSIQLNGTDAVLSGSTGLKFPTSGGTAAALDYYEIYLQVIQVSGIWAAPLSANLSITRVGKSVVVRLSGDVLSAATIATTISAAAGTIPTRFLGSNESSFTSFVRQPFLVRDNGTDKLGSIQINADGSFSIGAGPSTSTAFAGSGSSGFPGQGISWSL